MFVGKIIQFIILSVSTITVLTLDVYVICPFLLQNVPFPFSWLFIAVLTYAELYGLLTEAGWLLG
jgi:hypothetical protein